MSGYTMSLRPAKPAEFIAIGMMLGVTLVVLTCWGFGIAFNIQPVLADVTSGSSRTFHVLGVALPASLAAPAALEGINLATTSVNVTHLVLVNTDSSDHTVTVSDCQSTPFVLFNGETIAAKTMWPVPMGNVRFGGCFKWTASSTTVMGAVTGERP